MEMKMKPTAVAVATLFAFCVTAVQPVLAVEKGKAPKNEVNANVAVDHQTGKVESVHVEAEHRFNDKAAIKATHDVNTTTGEQKTTVGGKVTF